MYKEELIANSQFNYLQTHFFTCHKIHSIKCFLIVCNVTIHSLSEMRDRVEKYTDNVYTVISYFYNAENSYSGLHEGRSYSNELSNSYLLRSSDIF